MLLHQPLENEAQTMSRPDRFLVISKYSSSVKAGRSILGLDVAAGLIEHSTSKHSSPLVAARENGGLIQITVNYKPFNAASVVYKYPPLGVDGLIDFLGSGKVYSALNYMGYIFQVAIEPGSVDI